MKKHIIGVVIALVAIILSGVLLWMFVFKKQGSDLYTACTDYVYSNDTQLLQTSLTQANGLYTSNSRGDASEKRLIELGNIVAQLNTYEQDLAAYLTLDGNKASKISKTYQSLSGSRQYLLNQLDIYITRMSGNTAVSSSGVVDLYNQMVGETLGFIKEYNTCFNSTISHVFSKVSTTSNIKCELYSLYSACLSNLINTATDKFEFGYMPVIVKLNSGVTLENGNIKFAAHIIGGEFDGEVMKFKQYFNKSSLADIASNFIEYYNATNSGFDLSAETSNEKITMYYLKSILGV